MPMQITKMIWAFFYNLMRTKYLLGMHVPRLETGIFFGGGVKGRMRVDETFWQCTLDK